MRNLRTSLFVNSTALVALLSAGCSSSSFVVNPTEDAGDDTLPVDTGTDTGPGDTGDGGPVSALEIDPANAVVFIDTATTPATRGTQAYNAVLNGKDGKKDVTGSTKFSVDDPTVGTFAGNVFTAADKLSAGGYGVSTVVRATSDVYSAGASLTVVQIRRTGDKRDFFFTVPYATAPYPSRDVLKFSTNIKQVDVAVVMDTTGSMGGSIANLKTNLSSSLFPGLVKAIPSVGIGVVYHDDYPVSPYGYTPCGTGSLPGDLPVGVVQIITSDLAKAQAAANKLETHCGSDGPESQIPAMEHVLTGRALEWTGGSVPKHVPAPGTFGGVDFRPGSLPVVVEITDVDWHGEGHTPYGTSVTSPPTMATLKKAFSDANARFVDITNGSWSAPEDQANDLSDATKSNIPPTAFGTACGAGKCCTGMSGGARDPLGPAGSCRLNFLHNSGAGVSDSIIKAIEVLAVGSVFDVTAKASNDPANPDAVDATQFIKALRAMEEGDTTSGCPASPAKDSDGDGVKDTFTGVKVGTPVCFEVLPAINLGVKPKGSAQFFNAFVDVLGMPGSIKLDRRVIVFLVPPKFGT